MDSLPFVDLTKIDWWWKDLKGLPDHSAAKDRLSGVFGMCEMEVAAKVVIEKCQKARTWECFHRLEDFKEDAMALVGFCHLAHGDFLRPAYPNSCFVVTAEFVKRVTRPA